MYSEQKKKKKIKNLLNMFNILFADPIDLKNGKGFLVYSDETIDNTSNSELKRKYENECKEINNKKERNIYRYYYYEKIENDSPLHATIVMMNPAFADSEKPDNTINNIEKYIKEHNNKDLGESQQIGSFDIVNLYPIRMPKSKKFKDFKKIMKKNPEKYQAIQNETQKYRNFVKKYIEENLENRIIIAAWGNDKQDNDDAKELFINTNTKFYCYGLTTEGYPKHFSSLSYNHFYKFKYLIPYIRINNWLNKEPLSEYDNARLKNIEELKKWLNVRLPIAEYFTDHILNQIKNLKKTEN